MPNLSEQLNHHEDESLHTHESLKVEEDKNKQLNVDQFSKILERILPHISHDEDKIISAQVILGLKLEGILGDSISESQSQMIEIIKDSILQSDEKRESALLLAQRIIDKLEL